MNDHWLVSLVVWKDIAQFNLLNEWLLVSLLVAQIIVKTIVEILNTAAMGQPRASFFVSVAAFDSLWQFCAIGDDKNAAIYS